MEFHKTVSSYKDDFDAITKLIGTLKSGGNFAKILRKKKLIHLSFSQIAAVEFCQYRYYLHYVKEASLVEEPNYFVKGKLMHEFLASSYLKISKKLKINPQIYNKTIARHFDNHHRVHLENAVQVHLNNLWLNYEILGVEKPFVFQIDNILPPFVGVIDLLLKKDNQVIIVDHKTGRDFYSPDELQMAIYLNYAEKNYSNCDIKIYYDHYRWVNNLDRIRKPALLRSEVSLPTAYWTPALERIHEGFAKIKKIREEKRAKRTGECFRCPLFSIC